VSVPSYPSERSRIFVLGVPIFRLSAIFLFNLIEVSVPS